MDDTNKKIDKSIKNLEEMEDKNSKEYAKELENLGLYYYEMGNTDKAIEMIEESLRIRPTITQGYKTLMGIYNTKRAEAAKNGDMKEINKWLDKMDVMRNVAKKGTLFR